VQKAPQGWVGLTVRGWEEKSAEIRIKKRIICPGNLQQRKGRILQASGKKDKNQTGGGFVGVRKTPETGQNYIV